MRPTVAEVKTTLAQNLLNVNWSIPLILLTEPFRKAFTGKSCLLGMVFRGFLDFRHYCLAYICGFIDERDGIAGGAGLRIECAAVFLFFFFLQGRNRPVCYNLLKCWILE